MLKALKDKKILLGISGSIAAYKTPILIRELRRAGAEVKVAATPSALRFVTKDVLINLSQHDVAVEIFDEEMYQGGAWHIHLAHWCDAYLIAPASATTLSRLTNGACDTTVSALYVALPRDKKAIVAPAMDHDMYEHPATQSNLKTIEGHGTLIIQPEEGELSSGIIGKGRLPEPLTLVEKLEYFFTPSSSNENVLITAGPTREPIDNVRYISNHSSGKMGVALANEAARRGMAVKLVLGPISSDVRRRLSPLVEVIDVESADEMFNTVEDNFQWCDRAIMAAAVADYRTQKFDGKIKKEEKLSSLELVENKDILKHFSQMNSQQKLGKFIVGFALESQNAIDNAQKKLKSKGCDLIVLNEAAQKDSGFGGDKNTVTLLWKKNNQIQKQTYSPKEKSAVAVDIYDMIAELSS